MLLHGTSPDESSPIIWTGNEQSRARARITNFLAWLATERGLDFDDYAGLWSWSTRETEAFWAGVWDYFDVQASKPYDTVLTTRSMPDQRWFPGSQLNYAEHMLRAGDPNAVAIVALDERHPPTEITWDELRGQVGALAASLRALGVQPGDRVAGYLPNILPP